MFESWNGIPVHGLIGSVYPNYEYAFAMNTFQAVGIMAPIARYEDKFARDLAKWILNVSSNSRYFYPDAWSPEQHQASMPRCHASLLSYAALFTGTSVRK